MAETNDALTEIHSRYFEQLKHVTHREVAVAAALDYSAQHYVSPPFWVVQESAPIMLKLLMEQKPTIRGRHASHISRYRQDMLDIDRWHAVKLMREKQAYYEREHVLAKVHPGATDRYKADIEKAHDWAGTDWIRVYECAAMYLRGSDSYASPDAMKASYQKVNLADNSDPKAVRYFVFDFHFLDKIMPPSHAKRWARKIGELFSLTI